MKKLLIFALLSAVFICSCSRYSINRESSKLEKIGTDEPLIEILTKHQCVYPLYVNSLPDTFHYSRPQYPNPCSPSEIRTFIFFVEENGPVNIKLKTNLENSFVVLVNSNLPQGYYKLSFPEIDRKYFEEYIRSNRRKNVTIAFLIGNKLFYHYLFNG